MAPREEQQTNRLEATELTPAEEEEAEQRAMLRFLFEKILISNRPGHLGRFWKTKVKLSIS
jgi:hypothetical protein